MVIKNKKNPKIFMTIKNKKTLFLINFFIENNKKSSSFD